MIYRIVIFFKLIKFSLGCITVHFLNTVWHRHLVILEYMVAFEHVVHQHSARMQPLFDLYGTIGESFDFGPLPVCVSPVCNDPPNGWHRNLGIFILSVDNPCNLDSRIIWIQVRKKLSNIFPHFRTHFHLLWKNIICNLVFFPAPFKFCFLIAYSILLNSLSLCDPN